MGRIFLLCVWAWFVHVGRMKILQRRGLWGKVQGFSVVYLDGQGSSQVVYNQMAKSPEWGQN